MRASVPLHRPVGSLVAAAVAALYVAIPAAQSRPANETLTAVPGIKAGHVTLPDRPTGCTVVLAEAGVTAAIDVRGAAPATRETDLLDPVNSVQVAHAIALSGGSAFGLDSASGVMRYLEERKIGFAFGNAHVPIVPAASLFDLGVGDGRIRPTADCGYRAAQAASANAVAEGSVGAGAGATVGKANGTSHAMKAGVGTAALALPGGLVVSALVVVNAFGDVIDPASGRVIAGVRADDGHTLADARTLLRSGAIRFVGDGQNTTLGVVATNAVLTKTDAKRVAQMAHDGYARALAPVHTPVDGDTIFVLATGAHAGRPDVGQIGALAADVVAQAIVRAARQATSIAGFPAVRDLK
jgi:L-aminopeptidase/D-esterase-like protein